MESPQHPPSTRHTGFISMDWQWDLLQNCDLPPPLKLEKKKITLPEIAQWDAELEPTKQTENTSNTSLTRALQLSQSRAREAEKKAAAVSATSEQMAAMLLAESAKLSAHRRWVRLLETEILLINRKKKFTRPECKETKRREEEEEEEEEFPALTWCLTLAICFGIGFALSKIF